MFGLFFLLQVENEVVKYKVPTKLTSPSQLSCLTSGYHGNRVTVVVTLGVNQDHQEGARQVTKVQAVITNYHHTRFNIKLNEIKTLQ